MNNLVVQHGETVVDHWRQSRLFVLLLVLVFFLPLPLGLNREWAWSLFEGGVFLLAALWLYEFAVERIVISKVFYRARWLLLCLFIVVLWQLFQLLPLPLSLLSSLSSQAAQHYSNVPGYTVGDYFSISLDLYATWQSVLLSLALFVLFALVLLLVTDRHRLRLMLYVMFYAGLLQAVLASIFLFGSWEGLSSGVTNSVSKSGEFEFSAGTFVNRNHLAGFLEMTISVGIGLLLTRLSRHSPSRWRERLIQLVSVIIGNKARVRLMLIIMIIVLVLTHSRMGNMAFFLSFFTTSLVLLFASMRRREKNKSLFTPAIVLLLSMLIVDLFIVGNWFGVDRIVERVGNTTVATEDRSDVFSDTIEMGKQYWLTGVGGGAFASSFPAYQSSNYYQIYDHVHNDYLEFAVELGVPVLSLLSVVVIYSLGSAFWAMIRTVSRFYGGVAFAAFMGIFSILLHSLADFNLRIPSNAAYFVVLLAVAIIARYHIDEPKTTVPDACKVQTDM